jgi:hypothetical protein
VIVILGVALAAAAPRIDLYTMGPGDELFSRFGHGALCVENGGRTRCYNWGSTTIRPLELTVGFLRATARFEVTTSSLDRMLAKYRAQDRRMWRQRLALTDEQAVALARRVEHDALPANKYYFYDHFDENCTTRIRDHIDAVTDGALSAHSRDVPWDRTLRDAVRQGMAPDLPAAAGIEMVTGAYIDRVPSLWEAMFLPDVLRAEVERSLGAVPEEIVSPSHERIARFPLVGPALLAASGALGAIAARVTGRFGRAACAVLLALVGLVLWIVTAAAVAPSFRDNLAALFFWPSDLALLSGRWGRRYARARWVVAGAIVLMSLVGIVKQSLLGPAALGCGLLLGSGAARS